MFDAKKKELVFANGRAVACEDVRESQEICHQTIEYLRVLGYLHAPKLGLAVPCGVLRGKFGEQKKKKIRISIDRTVIKNDLV